MTEAEELELLELEAEEAEAQATPAPTPQEPNKSLLRRGAEWVGRQASRLPAAIRGGVQAYQSNDAPGAAGMAVQGFMDPESVQSSGQMMANAGVSTEPKMQIKQPPPDAATQFAALGNLPPEVKEAMLGFKAEPETTYTTQAQEYGNLFDAVAPSGLEFLPPGIRGMFGSAGKGMQKAGTASIQSSLKPASKLMKSPVPYESENFLKPRPGFPDGLGSAMGKGKTLENLEAYHQKLGDQQDAILNQIPQVDILQAVAQAAQDVQDAISKGGNSALGLSARDAAALQSEIQHWADAAERVSPSGVTNGKNARQFRGSLGTEAKYNGSPESTNARRVVAATIRERLNEQFTQLSPEFRKLDREFAETIPLRNATAEALGKEGNRYPIGLRTGMILATGGTSIPLEMAKTALVEGSSRFAPQMATAKAGRAIAGAAEAARPLDFAGIPPLLAARAAYQNQNRPPKDPAELAEWVRNLKEAR